jgi:probable HAF family extracellular repeat protein
MAFRWTIRGVVLMVAVAGLLAIEPQRSFRIVRLDSLGGVNSRANSINNLGLVSGYSNLAAGDRRHATAWVFGKPFDLGTLGGPNSNIAWPVKNLTGVLAGIAQTSEPEPDEAWSCSAFFGAPFATGFTCRGVVWEFGRIRALPTLGGRNSFATGVNNRRQIVGWSENTVEDPATCAPPQIFQFRAVVWGPGRNDIRELPLVSGDNSSAATAINDAGQVVGISGTCDQAVGRATAKHAVLWNRGQITEIPNIGSDKWNTPMAINQQGDIVGFLGQPGDDPDNPRLRAFLWTRERGTENLGTLPGDDYSEARGINERRQVVGVSCVDPSLVSCRAFFWENGEMFDLNDLAPSRPGGAVLINAQDINDVGVISGRAFIAGPPADRYAFVAIPGPRLAATDAKNPESSRQESGRVTLPADVALELRSPMGPLQGVRLSRPGPGGVRPGGVRH